MVPRRTHKKSRNGCVQCKQRRVKCDEKGPICHNCTKRQLPCSFKDAPPESPVDSLSEKSADVSSTARENQATTRRSTVLTINKRLITPNDANAKQVRSLELGLLHHWTTVTYATLAQDRFEHGPNIEYRLWQIDVPREAMKHEYLLNAILAVAALHVLSLPPEKQYVPVTLAHAIEYHTASCATLRSELATVNDKNCHAVFACSILMILSVLALPPPADERTGHTSSLSAIFAYTDILTGTRDVLYSLQAQLIEGPFRRMMDYWQTRFEFHARPDTKAAIQILRGLNHETHVENNPIQCATNAMAIDILETCFAELDNRPDFGVSIAWLGSLDGSVIANLQRHEPVALAMLICWGVMLEQPSPMWFVHRPGKALIQEILSLKLHEEKKWTLLVAWAKDRAGMETSSIPVTCEAS
ncbi:hypothetical protein EJ05DRAFT_497178 [Pseudovirgaria hyperparasitica]|uniref:Zn(2)-C6 fungal-type domain-containing protein n=1 Tax=Pseudovirgaria hyperparasitica TaxID=470096 RepID=A0A6A6WHP0_9PEZI|nr:uncharacterized protein EJ05DRAFT_497178 [Pseudovirgaria hyperparasitica]KAF2762323.1 hypothetical protein EJ05DRAFT_497178 [Pseudovirgaria hyperparasitica]